MRAKSVMYEGNLENGDTPLVEARFTPETIEAELLMREMGYGVFHTMLGFVQGEQCLLNCDHVKKTALLLEYWLPDGWNNKMSCRDDSDMNILADGLYFLLSPQYASEPSYEGSVNGRAFSLEIFRSEKDRDAAAKRIEMLHAAIDDHRAVPALKEAMEPLWDPWMVDMTNQFQHKTAVAKDLAVFIKTLRKHYLPGDRVVLANAPVVLELEDVERDLGPARWQR